MLPNRVRGEYTVARWSHVARWLWFCWDMGEYRKRSQRLAVALGVAAAVTLGGCATLPDDPEARQAMREANDRGFECVLVADCCAATDRTKSQVFL